jgi:hypothetical protein
MELSYSPPEQQDGLQDLVGRTRDEGKAIAKKKTGVPFVQITCKFRHFAGLSSAHVLRNRRWQVKRSSVS